MFYSEKAGCFTIKRISVAIKNNLFL